MMTLDDIRNALQDRNIKAISRAAGVSYYAIRQIKAGKAQRPSHAVVAALSDYLQERKAA